MKLRVKIYLNIQAVFFLGLLDFLDACKSRVYNSPSDVSGNRLFQSVEKQVAYSQQQFHKPQCLGIGDPKFSPRFSPTIISKRFDKLSIIKYYAL